MSYKRLTCLVILFCISFHSITLGQVKGKKKPGSKSSEILSTVNLPQDYEVFWRKIDSLDENKMTQSAKKIAEDIYRMAVSEKNNKQTLKALLAKLSYEKVLDKENESLIIKEMQGGINLLGFPERNILMSALAGEYYQFYSSNLYNFRTRSEIQDDSTSDFESWSLKKIRNEAEKLFFASLERSGELKQIPASEYSDFIIKGNYYGYKFRPTLYDMLCHYALNCFRNGLFYIDRFGFSIPDEAGLWGTADEFISTLDVQKDSSFAADKIIRILKELTLFHIKDSSKSELADIDLIRLDYLKGNSNARKRDSLYQNSLCKMLDYYKGSLPSSRVLAQLASFYKQLPSNWYRSEDYKWNRKKALVLCDSAIVNFPGSFGAKESEIIKSEILRKYLSLDAEHAVLPGEPFRVLVTCQNVNKVYFRIIEESLVKADTIFSYGSSLIKFLRSIRPLKAFEQMLPDRGDYHTHKYDAFFPPLPLGKYVILASADSDFSDSSGLTFFRGHCVTNLSAIIKKEGKYAKLYVLDRKSGQPLKDVTVEHLNTREPIRLETDKNGLADLPLYFQHRDLILSKENDSFMIEDNSARQNKNEDEERYSGETVFFFDRGIYRPGQTVFFKGVSLLHKKSTGAYEAWKGREVTVTLRDANGRNVNEIKLETNDYGTFSGQFNLPENVLTGRWTVQDGYSSDYFLLEEYKRPQFEVRIDKIKGEYSINDEVKVTGSVESYSGALLSAAKVKFTISRTPVIYYGNRRYTPGFRGGVYASIASGNVTTGENGEFIFSFKPQADPVDKSGMKVYKYFINVEVTDRTGEMQKAETSMMAGDVSILSGINVPGVVVKGKKQSYDIVTAGMDGNFRPAEVKLSVYKLGMPDRVFRISTLGKPDTNLVARDEFYRTFSNEAYLDEQNFTSWQKEHLVMDTAFVTVENQTLESKIFSRLKQGKYVLIFSAKDKNGKSAEMIKYFTFLDPVDKNIPLNEALWLYPLKAEAAPGEELEVSFGTALNNMYILFEIESKEKITERKWFKLSNEQRVLKIPIEEDYQGYIDLHCLAIWNNSIYTLTERVNVPWSNKKLKLELQTFRNKITPGETETWKIRVKDEDGNPAEAEVIASMYDQSLEALGRNYGWEFNIFNDYYSNYQWNSETSFSSGSFHTLSRNNWYYQSPSWIWYNELYYYGLGNVFHDSGFSKSKSRSYESSLFKSSPFRDWIPVWGKVPNIQKDNTNAVKEIKEEAFTFVDPPKKSVVSLTSGIIISGMNENIPDLSSPEKNKLMNVTARRNFSETAFFYPHLLTNDEGTAEFSFKVPEVLTKWKFMAFAHTEDLASGMITASAVTQKSMMVQSFPPRFFRENDTIWYTARVSNLTDTALAGHVQLMSFDASAMTAADASLGNENPLQELHLNPKETKVFKWKLTIPESKFNSISCRVSALCGSYSDGEENQIPVLGNRMMITESMLLPVMGSENRSFVFENLRNNTSSSLKNFRLTLEFTSNPAFLALEALPSLMDYSFETADNVFNSYYACSIAMHIANSYPGFKEVFNAWKASGKGTLSSSLKKNQEIKDILLEETPWLGEAQNEEEQKARLGELFDFSKLGPELSKAEVKLRNMQSFNGGWAWFPGLEENICLTQSIIAGFGHLEKLGIPALTPETEMGTVLLKAIHSCDEKMYKDYLNLKKKDSTLTGVYLDNEKIQYLYARSFFTKYPLYMKYEEAFNFWKKKISENWQNRGLYLQGMIALMCSRYNDNENAEKIMRSVLDNAVSDKEMGMYFQQESGYYWYEAPIERQALLIEAADEILHDTKSVDRMKVWLLKNKQTHSWKSPRATSEAVYALLLRGTDWVKESTPAEIQIGNEKLDLMKSSPEAGTGYVKMSWDADRIRPEMSKVMVTNKNNVPAWGALYWQYFEKLDNLAQANSSLSIKKDLFLKTGDNKLIPVKDALELKAGDELKVRLVIKTDRDMEFVHIKDMRASGLEPVNVLSGSRRQDGLYYYEATKDASTNFFMDRLPKGTYVFEYPLKVTYNGTFSNGIAEIQCLYAPEFRSHSGETHLRVQ